MPGNTTSMSTIFTGFFVGGIAIFVIITGCLQSPTTTAADASIQNSLTHNSSIEITDALNNRIVLENHPHRIITQNGRILPLIISLGGGEEVVGVPENSMSDTEVMAGLPNAQSVGDWQTMNTEKILSLNPDILIAYTSWKPKNIDQLAAQNLTIIYLDCYHVARLPTESRTLGRILGKEEESDAYAQNIEYYLSLIHNRVALLPENRTPPRAYAELYSDYQVMGNGSMGEEELNLLKIDNIAHEVHLNPVISREWVVENNPDIIIKIASDSDRDYPDLKRIHDRIAQRDGFSNISAVKNDRIYVINSEAFSGARSIAGALYLAKVFYPEYFTDIDPIKVFESYNQTFKPAIDSQELFYPSLSSP
ncbi:MAG: ABC transporter substrate-binding protein [Methanoregula sp.]|nr:ABC transporter substrate-binding protein [Methanoregula sp.]